MRVLRSAIAMLLLAGCRKEDAAARDAGARFEPAPSSTLAQLLEADDAGRGRWSMNEDGPNCGKPPIMEPTELGNGSMRGFSFYRVVDTPRQLADRDNQAPVRLHIKAPTHAKPGVEFDVSLTLVNQSPKPLVFEHVIEGSSSHWRSPFFDTYLKDTATGTIYRWSFGPGGIACGNIMPRRTEDFGRVEPGKELGKDAGAFGYGAQNPLEIAIDKKGRYEVWVVYAACRGPNGKWRHPDGEDVVPPPDTFMGEIVSNGVTIEVD